DADLSRPGRRPTAPPPAPPPHPPHPSDPSHARVSARLRASAGPNLAPQQLEPRLLMQRVKQRLEPYERHQVMAVGERLLEPIERGRAIPDARVAPRHRGRT